MGDARPELDEKLEFQYIMNSKAYRRIAISVRVVLVALIAGGLAVLSVKSLPLGIVMPLITLFLGVILILACVNKEETYMIFNTRFVIKVKEKRVSVPLENIVAVKYKRAFYEKDLATGTVTITAKDPVKGKLKKYKLLHVFDAKPGVKFLQDMIEKGKVDNENNG